MAFLLVVLGYVLGVLFFGENGGITGIMMAVIVWVIMTLVAYYGANDIFLSISKAKKIAKEDHPRLFNVVEEMKIVIKVIR